MNTVRENTSEARPAAGAAARPLIGILGGTGDLGSGLALRWSRAGYPIVLGSRQQEKAEQAARGVAGNVRGATNYNAARESEIVVIAVPFESHAAILEEIRPVVAGKLVIDAVVPLMPPKVAVVQLPQEGSAAQIAQRILGPQVKLVSALHNVGAEKLRGDGPIDCDVLVCGDDKDAREEAIALVDAIGARGVHGGALANSAAAEALTSVLISINRRYKVEGAGIRITGLDAKAK